MCSDICILPIGLGNRTAVVQFRVFLFVCFFGYLPLGCSDTLAGNPSGWPGPSTDSPPLPILRILCFFDRRDEGRGSRPSSDRRAQDVSRGRWENSRKCCCRSKVCNRRCEAFPLRHHTCGLTLKHTPRTAEQSKRDETLIGTPEIEA